MAVNATFTADFSDFLTAIDQAEIALVDFGKGASTVEKKLNAMVDNFSGRKLIQEASLLTIAVEKAGGVANLTAKELEYVGNKANEAADKMQKLGYEVPKGLQDLADATKKTTTATDDWGTSLSTVSGILGAFGISLSIGAIVNFGKEILADADALMRMSAQTGLTTDALQKFKSVGDASGVTVEQITAAILQMQNRIASGDKSAMAAIETLGIKFSDFQRLAPEDQFIALAEAIDKVEDPSKQVALSMDTMGKAGVAALPAIKEGFDGIKNTAPGMSSVTVKALDDMGDSFGFTLQKAKDLGAWFLASGFMAATMSESARIADDLAASIARAADAATKGAPGFGALVKPEIPANWEAISDKLTDSANAMIEADKAAKPFREAMDALSLAGTGWVKVLDTIDGNVVEAVKYYLAAGVSQKALADAYGLTTTQIEAVDKARKNELAGLSFEEAAKKRMIEIQGILLKATNDAVLAKLKAQQADEAALKAEMDAALKAEEWWSKATEGTKKTTAATEEATKATGVYMNQLHMLVSDPKLAAFFGGNVVANTLYSGGQGGFTPEEAAAIGAGQFINMAGIGAPGFGQRRAAGGPVTAGQPYLVGERGPELFVPGQSGAIATGAGPQITINVSQPLGTPEAIARAVGDALTARSRALGQRL